MNYTELHTPIGSLLVAGDDLGLRFIFFESERKRPQESSGWHHDPAPLAAAVEQLRAYFAGELRDFDLQLAPQGTPFQLDVWHALSRIPYGETISYGELACQIGRSPTASRAVGAANGANPLPIVLPCHRVIGANGSLVGFGGGLELKAALLDAERSATDRQHRLFDRGAARPFGDRGP